MKSDPPFEIPGGYGTGYDKVLTRNDESSNPQKSENMIPTYILKKSKHNLSAIANTSFQICLLLLEKIV